MGRCHGVDHKRTSQTLCAMLRGVTACRRKMQARIKTYSAGDELIMEEEMLGEAADHFRIRVVFLYSRGTCLLTREGIASSQPRSSGMC